MVAGDLMTQGFFIGRSTRFKVTPNDNNNNNNNNNDNDNNTNNDNNDNNNNDK